MEEQIQYMFKFVHVNENLIVCQVFDTENGDHLHSFSKDELSHDGWYCVDSGTELRGELYKELTRACRGWKHNIRFKTELEPYKRIDC